MCRCLWGPCGTKGTLHEGFMEEGLYLHPGDMGGGL